ncbi:MAG: carbohydrate-binding domain-containing protein [Clostridia bacterium]|nr:carbohydrate-binding domain-containing protein [Clostridia bacterium]
MKSKCKLLSSVLGLLLALALCMCLVFAGCSSSGDDTGNNGETPSGQDGDGSGNGGNEGNSSGGTAGNEGNATDNSGSTGGSSAATDGIVAPVGSESMTATSLKADALEAAGDVSSAVYTTAEEVLADDSITEVTNKKISDSGSYYIDDTNEVAGNKITIAADDVTLYLIGAALYNDGTAIESEGYDLTITVIGENSIYNTKSDKNSIDIEGTLTINGPGSLSVSSTKNIKATSFVIADATVSLSATKDALHAEIPEYDDYESAPTFSFTDGGFVYTKNASVTVTEAGDDGIQADTFVYIDEGSSLDVTATGKGIKAGCIDWGENDTELADGDYFIYINGDVTVNSTDDAIHSNNTIIIEGGCIDIASTGDDAVHADNLLQVYDGTIEILDCYEGLEAAKVEITGGYINLVASDDGINAADGTENAVGTKNSNCSLLINGGVVYVEAGGDGADSNGDLTISGGILYIAGASNGSDQGLDADGSIIITGGYLFAAGASGMAATLSSSSTQNSVVFTYSNSSVLAAGTIVYLQDADGNNLLYYALPKTASVIVLSSPELTTGSTYYIYGGDTRLASFTITGTITNIGSSNSSITTPGGGSQSGSSNGSFGGSGIGGGQGGITGGFGGSGSFGGSSGRH